MNTPAPAAGPPTFSFGKETKRGIPVTLGGSTLVLPTAYAIRIAQLERMVAQLATAGRLTEAHQGHSGPVESCLMVECLTARRELA